MSRTAFNFLLDALLFSIVMALLFITAVLRFVFPSPTSAEGWKLWGHGYDAWANLQVILVLIAAFAILLHIMLHWSWVCGVFVTKLARGSNRRVKLDDGSKTLWGVGMLILVLTLLGALVGLANVMIESPVFDSQ